MEVTAAVEKMVMGWYDGGGWHDGAVVMYSDGGNGGSRGNGDGGGADGHSDGGGADGHSDGGDADGSNGAGRCAGAGKRAGTVVGAVSDTNLRSH